MLVLDAVVSSAGMDEDASNIVASFGLSVAKDVCHYGWVRDES